MQLKHYMLLGGIKKTLSQQIVILRQPQNYTVFQTDTLKHFCMNIFEPGYCGLRVQLLTVAQADLS